MSRKYFIWPAVAALLAIGVVGCADRGDPVAGTPLTGDPVAGSPAPGAVLPTPTATATPVPSLADWWDKDETEWLDPGGFTVSSALGVMYPPFAPETKHYAVRCLDGGKLTLAAHTDLVQRSTQEAANFVGDPEFVVQGVSLPEHPERVARAFHNESDEEDIPVTVVRDGARAEYVVHCVPADFPDVQVRRLTEPTRQLMVGAISVGRRPAYRWEIPDWAYLTVIDWNGVPRWQRRVDDPVSVFRVLEDDRTPFAWTEFIGYEPDPYAPDVVRRQYRIALMDHDLEVVSRERAVGLFHTDPHDFALTPEGSRVFLSYEPAERDLSAYGDYAQDEPTRDSVVQVVTPGDDVLLEWNSWDHVPIADCLAHRFPDDYAHVNSAEEVEGNLLLSLRGCSRVMMVDGSDGRVLWSVGKTVHDGDWYRERGWEPPLRVEGDPQGVFCGQHSAQLLDGNRLLVYDNAVHCVDGPLTNGYSRVVEYELDFDAGVARFLREHSMFGEREVLTVSAGMVALLDNGDWLISWGRPGAEKYADSRERPLASVSEVDPDTGLTRQMMRFVYPGIGRTMTVRMWPVPSALQAELPAWAGVTGRGR